MYWLQDRKLLINQPIFHKLKYQAATTCFHQWRNEHRQVLGLSFPSEQDAQKFHSVVLQAMDYLAGEHQVASTAVNPTSGSNGGNAIYQDSHYAIYQHQQSVQGGRYTTTAIVGEEYATTAAAAGTANHEGNNGVSNGVGPNQALYRQVGPQPPLLINERPFSYNSHHPMVIEPKTPQQGQGDTSHCLTPLRTYHPFHHPTRVLGSERGRETTPK